MNRTVWLHRGSALAVLIGVSLTVSGTAGIARSLMEVRDAEAATPVAPPTAASTTSALWKPPPVALRVQSGDAKASIGEFFNGKLGDLGLLTTSVETTSLRPLGEGLKLVEVTIRAKGRLEAAIDVSNWIAVNREAVRLQSITVSSTDQGEAQLTLVVLTVIA